MSQLLRYFNKWKLRVNVSKTELILFTKRRPLDPQPLQFHNVTIPWSHTVKYLGLLLDSKQLFTKHLQTVLHKATGTLLRIFPLLARDSPLTIPNKILLYRLLKFHDHIHCTGMELNISNQLSSSTSLSIKMPPRYWGFSPEHSYIKPPRSPQIIPIRQFIYRLTDKFFVSCPAHPNPLIRNTGNYTLEDLHRQYTKYKHKRIQHTLL